MPFDVDCELNLIFKTPPKHKYFIRQSEIFVLSITERTLRTQKHIRLLLIVRSIKFFLIWNLKMSTTFERIIFGKCFSITLKLQFQHSQIGRLKNDARVIRRKNESVSSNKSSAGRCW